MDGHRFDKLTKTLAGSHSRRGFARIAAGGTIAAMLGRSKADLRGTAASADIALCHKPGSDEQSVVTVASSALQAHLDHGDIVRIDCCPGDACEDPFATCGGGGEPGRCGCTPHTCAGLGLECGQADNGCGGQLDCGSCCTPKTCEDLGDACGLVVEDGCGTVLDCGPCCVPKTCADQRIDCGPATDGCGIPIDCGPCTCTPAPIESTCQGLCGVTTQNNCGDDVTCPATCPICRTCFQDQCLIDGAQSGSPCAGGKVCCRGECVSCLAAGTPCSPFVTDCSAYCLACCKGSKDGVCL
jgi:hypothetical protein